MSDPNTNMIVNSVYHASVIAGLMMADSWAMKMFKMKPADLSKFDFENIAKLAGNVLISTLIRDWLVKQGYIPDKITN